MKRKICVITGTRADYGILNLVMKAIKNSHNLELYIIATCMHLMKEFGCTVKEIEKDGFNIYEKINISYRKDTGQAMAFSVGKAVSEFSISLDRLKPDVVVVLGDRGEMLAAAIAANYLNIPVAHIHGGEVSGHIDGLMRHAITKLSHVHFPATTKSAQRILRLGEEKWHIFVSGAPALDRILKKQVTKLSELVKKYKINKNQPLLLVAQHAVNAEALNAAGQMKVTLEAINNFKLQTIVIYPNADAGGRSIIKVIKKYIKHPFFKIFNNIPHKDYLGLLNIAAALIGNSSSGIVEAPSFKLPVINIGNRQKGRERSINVIDVPHDKNMIIKAIKKALFDKKFREQLKKCKNPYGDGHASERIVKILSSIKLGNRLLQKQITY